MTLCRCEIFWILVMICICFTHQQPTQMQPPTNTPVNHRPPPIPNHQNLPTYSSHSNPHYGHGVNGVKTEEEHYAVSQISVSLFRLWMNASSPLTNSDPTQTITTHHRPFRNTLKFLPTMEPTIGMAIPRNEVLYTVRPRPT
jgi:hypothetical protein